ncbi:unnamed protein product [Rotaria sp. Silwood2]|nr:unnamed protein product [Rotaria sp. Silwood2]
MSPTSSSSTIYDHLMINFQQQPKMIMRNNATSLNSTYDISNNLYSSNSRSDCDNLSMMKKTKSIPINKDERSKRRYTITHLTVPEPIVRCSVSNQAYDKAIIQQPLTSPNISSTCQDINSACFHSPFSKNIQVKQMDFRPLITNGRRRFTTISSASPMIIIKKKSLSPMHNMSLDQKQLRCTIPVNITSSNTPIVVSTVITSSLCSPSSSSSTTSTHGGTVTVPIQVIKTQKNNNKNNTIFTTTNKTNESQKGYRYVQKQSQQFKPLTIIKTENKVPLSFILTGDDNGPTRMPSSSSVGGDGNNHNSTIMTDSNVLRLIRRYDPVGANIINIQNRRSLENDRRAAFHEASQRSKSSLPSNLSSSSCTYLSQLTSSSAHNDNCSVKQSPAPRLQHQQAIDEQELSPSPSSSNKTNASVRPILKYTPPTSRAELNVSPKKIEPLTIKIEPLTIEIEPHVPLTSSIISNENAITYQPLITTGTKRVCAAISKSEWDLRLQNDVSSSIVPPSSTTPTFPVRSPSPYTIINQQQEKEPYRTLLDQSKSSIEIKNNNDEDDHIDDLHKNSSSITTGSCVKKLQELFNIKSSSLDLINSPISKQQKTNSVESNLNRHLNIYGTSVNKSDVLSLSSSLVQKLPNSKSIESQIHKISSDNLIKPITMNQEDAPTSSPLLKRPILKSQKAFDR